MAQPSHITEAYIQEQSNKCKNIYILDVRVYLEFFEEAGYYIFYAWLTILLAF